LPEGGEEGGEGGEEGGVGEEAEEEVVIYPQ